MPSGLKARMMAGPERKFPVDAVGATVFLEGSVPKSDEEFSYSSVDIRDGADQLGESPRLLYESPVVVLLLGSRLISVLARRKLPLSPTESWIVHRTEE